MAAIKTTFNLMYALPKPLCRTRRGEGLSTRIIELIPRETECLFCLSIVNLALVSLSLISVEDFLFFWFFFYILAFSCHVLRAMLVFHPFLIRTELSSTWAVYGHLKILIFFFVIKMNVIFVTSSPSVRNLQNSWKSNMYTCRELTVIE